MISTEVVGGETAEKRKGGGGGGEGQLLARVITPKLFSLSWPGKSFSLKREGEE